jgi:hypothetical protein
LFLRFFGRFALSEWQTRRLFQEAHSFYPKTENWKLKTENSIAIAFRQRRISDRFPRCSGKSFLVWFIFWPGRRGSALDGQCGCRTLSALRNIYVGLTNAFNTAFQETEVCYPQVTMTVPALLAVAIK